MEVQQRVDVVGAGGGSMPFVDRTRVVPALTVAALIAVVNGCASQGGEPESVAERVIVGVPENWNGPAPDLIEGNPAVGWLGEDEDEFGVMTFGSSTCLPIASAFDVIGPADVRIEFVESEQDPCTADWGAITHVFRLPDDVDRRPVLVTLSFDSGQQEFLSLP